MNNTVRVRFAPSPTGGLHLGGVRTALYNYLFAKNHGGKFILRIEDTDQTRFVAGAEDYIQECLKWCGIEPDESPKHGGDYGPYRQSERKAGYLQYAELLVKNGWAYYAFDTPEELDEMRNRFRTEENPSPQYNYILREKMRNSLTMNQEEVMKLLGEGTPYVIRIKVPENETITFTDMIRGEVSFDSSTLDDKVLLKGDGMPTYHLAVVVDDYLMKISHAFRGEEWLPSAPVHILIWRYLFGGDKMPEWAHLPLILKPDGNGKLSKRDGDRLGFPIFAMDWKDLKTGELTTGFKERGFLPEAFVNMLAVLGWNDGSEQELFAITELLEKFSMTKVHKGGAKFNFEKAKWFNHEYIKKTTAAKLQPLVKEALFHKGLVVQEGPELQKVIDLVKERCTLIPDFYEHASFFFRAPDVLDADSVKPKWNDAKNLFFSELIRNYELAQGWNSTTLEHNFKEILAANQLKPGELLLPFRIMLVGGKFGPGVFDIAEILGKEETVKRIKHALYIFGESI
ncbi:MAG: glutamate--tRNA ligase [Chitinophagaceae bacterium]|nr:glutamate--tRNA ligase [Chitinophagaceae bacterium]